MFFEIIYSQIDMKNINVRFFFNITFDGIKETPQEEGLPH